MTINRLVATLRPDAGGRLPVWLDAADYGQRVILNGAAVPWFDTAAFIAFEREVQTLLRPDVMTFEAGRFYAACLQTDPGLRAAMAEKKRLGFALRTLLAAADPRERQTELLRGLRASFSGLPLVLVIPAPRRWIASAHCAAQNLDTVEVSIDETEAGAVYVADYLNQFSTAGIDGLLLAETPDADLDIDAQFGAWQPIVNVAEHYRWALGLHAEGVRRSGSGPAPLAFSIGGEPPLSAAHATLLPAEFWAGDAPPATGDGSFYYGRVPADAVPERVLQQLQRLRD